MASAGNAVPVSYLIAGVITLLTAYSSLNLTLHSILTLAGFVGLGLKRVNETSLLKDIAVYSKM